MEIKDILTLTGVILTLLTLLKGIYEYKKAQTWKKLEFVAKEIKEFYNDLDNKRAMLLLDWNCIDIPVLDGELDTNPKRITIDDSIILTSLMHHSQKNNRPFNKTETLVRKIFDQFFFKLGIFNQFINTGLILEKDIKPYLMYWIELIAKLDSRRKSNELIKQIWIYINMYDNQDVIELCSRFGFDITKFENVNVQKN